MISTCLLCGHEGNDDHGTRDPVDGDWYCSVCVETANLGELPEAAITGEAGQ